MKCTDAARILNALQLGRDDSVEPALPPSDRPLLEDLAARGWVQAQAAGAPGSGRIAAAKAELEQVRSQYDAGAMAHDAYVRQEAALRSEILSLSEKSAVAEAGLVVGGTRYVLTYRGRSLLSAIAARLGRVDDLEIDEFERQVEGLRKSLNDRARRAKEIYQILRSAMPLVDAVSLRNASVGLAARSEGAREVSAAFQDAMSNIMRGPATPEGTSALRAVPNKRVALLAEVLVVGAPSLALNDIASQAAELVRLYNKTAALYSGNVPYEGAREDAAEGAAMLLSLPADKREATLEGAAAFRQAISEGGYSAYSIAPWILLAVTGLAFREGAGEWVGRMRKELQQRRCPPGDAEMATALLGASRGEAGGELLFQFDTARAYLSRLSEEGFTVPAAMLAAIPTSITETLDDLRMASAAASAHGLSDGGTENLSLGVKLLIQTALIAGGPTSTYTVGPTPPDALSPLGLAGLALILPTALVAVYAFHEVTLHQAAVNAYAFHPVHTHYIYG